jgi:uncharacterized protein
MPPVRWVRGPFSRGPAPNVTTKRRAPITAVTLEPDALPVSRGEGVISSRGRSGVRDDREHPGRSWVRMGRGTSLCRHRPTGRDVSLHDTIESDLRTAMKARDKARTSALRMVIAALKNRAVADGLGPQGRLDDEVVQKVLATEVKRRKEAAQAFQDAGREESAASEEAEATIYEAYLPAQLADAELEAIVDAAIAEVGADGPQQMGQVMKATMAQVQGRADGSRVSALVKQRLTS